MDRRGTGVQEPGRIRAEVGEKREETERDAGVMRRREKNEGY